MGGEWVSKCAVVGMIGPDQSGSDGVIATLRSNPRSEFEEYPRDGH